MFPLVVVLVEVKYVNFDLSREACLNFVELCKKKNTDRLWINELEAMQTCTQPQLSYMGTSGIVLTGEDMDPAQNIMMNIHNGVLSSMDQSSQIDLSVSDSTTSHASSGVNQGVNSNFFMLYFIVVFSSSKWPFDLYSLMFHGHF